MMPEWKTSLIGDLNQLHGILTRYENNIKEEIVSEYARTILLLIRKCKLLVLRDLIEYVY